MTHERIVSVAAKRIRERGLEGIRVADVRKEAAVAVGGFYKHFGSRDELVVEALATAFKDLDVWEEHTADMAQLLANYLTEAHRDAPETGCDGSVTRRHDSGEQIRASPLYGAGEAEPGILKRPSSIEPARE